MEPGRWKRIEEIYDALLERDEDERQGFLAEACGDDEALRREVESLLTEQPSGFLRPLAAAAINDRPHENARRAQDLLRAAVDPAAAPQSRAATLPIWAQVVLATAAIRIAAGLILYLGGDDPLPPRQLPYWVYAALASTFCTVGLALVV